MSVRDWKHCPRCRSALTLHADTADVHVACPACGFTQYENPVPTSIVVIENEAGEVLMVRRGHEPRRGAWDTVGGFLDLGETAEGCAHREVREELGVAITDLRPVGTFTSVYGEGGRQTIAVAFTARLDPPDAQITLSDENLEYAWCSLDALPEPLAFPDGRDTLASIAARRPLFHVTTRGEYDPQAAAHRPAGFATEGFVHLATRAQVAGVLERYYRGVPDLLLLELDPARLDGELLWEPGAGADPGPFPHLYAPVPTAAVVSAVPIAA